MVHLMVVDSVFRPRRKVGIVRAILVVSLEDFDYFMMFCFNWHVVLFLFEMFLFTTSSFSFLMF